MIKFAYRLGYVVATVTSACGAWVSYREHSVLGFGIYVFFLGYLMGTDW